MRTLELDEATKTLREFAREAGKQPLVLTESGKPVAVLLPIENADLESVSLSTNPRSVESIERSRARLAEEGGIPAEEVRRRLLR
jgi:PHD/YefM family antitoxin component YafN of YafNO toxin-antitoxin module